LKIFEQHEGFYIFQAFIPSISECFCTLISNQVLKTC